MHGYVSASSCTLHVLYAPGRGPMCRRQPITGPTKHHPILRTDSGMLSYRRVTVRAQQDDSEEVKTPSQPGPPSTSGDTGTSRPRLEEGQGTAIVTGAISIIFGVLYLVLVQLLDTRGNQLEPPPPEAFEQGWLHLLTGLF
ncbi:hypothetical protein CVIRNUC_006968 [Coccomyxa viridis]|uniref:Uncharacterized protein n=1 Tax=Coccomyxa viridis TaxID=1274662 RepID=A0AAV1I8S5_9CHLO|nr:hypothetical protein CVIRNUC_006968 [Coccomyxa viridis]